MSLVEALDADGKIAIWWLQFGGAHILGSTVPVRGLLIRTLGLRGSTMSWRWSAPSLHSS